MSRPIVVLAVLSVLSWGIVAALAVGVGHVIHAVDPWTGAHHYYPPGE